MKAINLMILSSVLLMFSSHTGNAAQFSEHCNGTCSSTGQTPAGCWQNVVHGGEHMEGENSTGNCGHDDSAEGGITCGDGEGSATFLNGTVAGFSCQGTDCGFTMDLHCQGNVFRGMTGSCSGPHPALLMMADGATCLGSPGNSTECKCAGSGAYCSFF